MENNLREKIIYYIKGKVKKKEKKQNFFQPK